MCQETKTKTKKNHNEYLTSISDWRMSQNDPKNQEESQTVDKYFAKCQACFYQTTSNIFITFCWIGYL